MMLVIGNKTFSSWSLRPWLLMKQFGLPFEEKLILLDQSETQAQILKFSPSGKVPVLIDQGLHIWESMAIAEYLSEKFPEKKMWPTDVAKRAKARAISNEMHGGFQKMRAHLPHDLSKTLTDFDWKVAEADIQRVQAIWTECLTESAGPFLFGEFSIADAMYAPVVNRFMTYGVSCSELLKTYMKTMRELPAHQEWIKGASAEK